MDINEDELLAAIRRVLSSTDPGVIVPVGDDAAVVRAGVGDLVLTTDALVEGTHFDRATSTAHDIGSKAIAVNVSDIAAMAASPRYALCALTLSEDVDAAWTMELFGGMREACEEFGAILVGGNVAGGGAVSVVVTLTGEVARGRAVTRAGAKPGDVVAVTGSLGGAAAGLRLANDALHGAWTDEMRDAIRRQQHPTPRVGEAQVLARHGATAMIDVSDGLALDLSRMCDASDVGVRLNLQDVPVHLAAAEGEAVGGGEDYELLATMPSAAAAAASAAELRELFGVPLTTIGTIVVNGLEAIDAAGRSRPLERSGWNHFA
jgi:thiamine-monophosphate kinase